MTLEEIDFLYSDSNYFMKHKNGFDLKVFDRYKFAKLVAEKEREACAEICENYGDEGIVDGQIKADYHAYLIRRRQA